MQKKKMIQIGLLASLIVLFIWSYNKLVNLEESVAENWSNVEAQYQRRVDLIPNLVNTVKGFAAQEKDVLTSVIEARSKATSIQIDPANLNASQIQQFQQAQGQLSGALSRLLVTVERYPELKSNQNFLELQAQLEGTENRINVSRVRYNSIVKDYNTVIRSIPHVILAKSFGYERKPLFEADQGAENAPAVSF